MPLQTATNPKTGESVALIGGEWQPITQTATNPAGQTAYLVGGQWVIDDAAAPQTAPQTTPKPQAPQRRTSDSVLEGAKAPEPLATEDPMLRPEFVTAIERQLAALPADQRAQTLASLTQRGDVYGRAARVVQGRFAAMDARKPKPSLISQTFDTPEEQARKQALATRRQPPSVSSGVFDPRVESQVYKLMSQGLLSPEEAGEYAEKELAQGRMPQVQRATAGFDVEAMPEQFMSGVKGMQQGYYASLAANRGADLNIMDRIDRGERVPDADDPMGYQYMPPEARAKARATVANSFVKNVADVVAYGAQQKLYVKNITADRLVKAANDKQWGSAWEAFKSDPAGIIQQMSVQSAPNALPSLIGGAAGVLMRGGIPAMMAGLATGSFPVEYMMSIVDSLQDAEVNLADTAAVEAKLRDPVFLQEAGKKAVTRGVAIATADALGGRLAMPLQPKQLLKNIARGGANVVTEVGTEMGGEFAAQTFSNEAIKIGEIIAEGLGAGPTAIASTMLATVNEQRKKAPPAALPPTAPPGTRTSGRTEPTFDGTAPPATELGGRVEPTLGEAPALNQEDRLTIERLVAIGIEPEDAQAMVEKAAAQRAAQEAPPVVSTRLEDLTNEYIDAGLPPEQAKELAIKRMRQEEEADKAAEEGERRAGETVTPPSGEGAGMAGVTEPGAPAAGLAGTERTGVVPTATDVGQPAVGEGEPPSAVEDPFAESEKRAKEFIRGLSDSRLAAIGPEMPYMQQLAAEELARRQAEKPPAVETPPAPPAPPAPCSPAAPKTQEEILAAATDDELAQALTTYGGSEVGRLAPDLIQAEIAKRKAAAAEPLRMRSAAFRSRETGEIVDTGPVHNRYKLPGGAQSNLTVWEDGFIGTDGNFYNREEAAQAVAADTKQLRTEDYDALKGLSPETMGRFEAPGAPATTTTEGAPKTKRGRPKAKAEAPKAEVPKVEVPEVEVPKQPDLSEGAPTQLKEVAAGKKRVPKAKVVEAKPGEITPPTTAPAKPAKPRGRPAKERTAEEVEAADKARREMALAANKDARSVAAAEKKLLGALAPLPKDAPQTTRQKAEADRQDAINTLYALSRRNKNKPGQRATEALKNPKITQEELAKAKADYEAKRGMQAQDLRAAKQEEQEEVQAKPGADMARLTKLLGSKIYDAPQEIAAVTVKELFQNAFDAIKESLEKGQLTTGKVKIKIDAKTRVISITDNGPGMPTSVMGNQFLQIAGTLKGSSRPSGGLGVAKMLFLFENKNLEVISLRNGVLSRMLTNGDSLKEAMEDSSKAPMIQVSRDPKTLAQFAKLFPEGHGTYISVQIPETYIDASTGDTKNVPFDSYSLKTNPVLENSPLFDPVNVEVDWGYGDDELPIGKRFPLQDFTPFANVNFGWGVARIVVSKDKKRQYGKNTFILSNGLWQFSESIQDKPGWDGKLIPRQFFIDVSPTVSADAPGYPFDLNRQRFTASARADFGKIFNYLAALFRNADLSAEATDYGTIQYINSSGAVTAPEVLQPTVPPTSTPLTAISPGDQVEIREGVVYVNNRPLPEITDKDLANTNIDINQLTVPQSQIDSTRVILQDNSKVPSQNGQSVSDLARSTFGRRFDLYSHGIGEIFMRLRDALANVDPARYGDLRTEGVGVVFTDNDKKRSLTFGINIRIPFKGMFVNPGLTQNYNNPKEIAAGMLLTMQHEIAHFAERRHDASFVNEFQRVMTYLDTRSGLSMYDIKRELAEHINRNKDIFDFINDLYRNENIEPRGRTFQNASPQREGDEDEFGAASSAGPSGRDGGVRGEAADGATGAGAVGVPPAVSGAATPSGAVTPVDVRTVNQIVKEINKAIDGFENSSNATDIAEGVSLLQSFRNYDNFKAYFGGLYETLNGARLSTLLFFLTNDMAASWGGSYVPELLKTNKLLIDMRSSSRKLLIGAKNLSDEMLRAISEDPSLKHKLERATAITTDVRVDPTSNTKFEQLNRIYESLGTKGQALYRKLRDYYANILAAYEHLLDSQIDDAKLPPGSKQVLMAEIKKMYETDKKIVPFFPFVRNRGPLWLRVGKGEARRFYTFANAAERKAVMAYLAKEMKVKPKQLLADGVFETGDSLESLRRATSDMTTALKKIFEKIDEAVDPKEIAGRVAVLTNTFKKEDPNLTDEEARAMAYEQAKEEATKDIKDTMYEMYLMVLPDQSFRRSFVSRQDIPGYNVDLIRNFATYATKISSQLPRIKYGPKLRTSLRTAEKFLDGNPDKAKLMRFVDEMTRRVDLDLNPYQTPPAGMSSTVLNALNTSVDFATRLAFVHYLSAAASAIVQATSFLYGASTLGARHGYARTAMEIGKMMLLWNEYGVQRQNEDGSITWHVPSVVNSKAVATNPMEKRFVTDMMGAGIGEYTMTGEMLGRGAVSTAAFEGRGSKLGRGLMMVLGGPFQTVERLVQETLAVPAFRMNLAEGRKKGLTGEALYRYAADHAIADVYDGIGNMAESNRPPVLRNALGRFLMQFMVWPLIITFRWMRESYRMVTALSGGTVTAIKGLAYQKPQQLGFEPSEEKDAAVPALPTRTATEQFQAARLAFKEFAGIMGVTWMLAGVSGLPFFSTVLGFIAEWFEGEDEEKKYKTFKDMDYWTWWRTVWLPEYMGQIGIFGRPLTEVVGMGKEQLAALFERGPTNMLTGLDIASRTSINPTDMFSGQNKEVRTVREGALQFAEDRAGPFVGMILSYMDAYNAFADGDLQKGMEKMLPAIARNPAIAFKYYNEGIKDFRGSTILNKDSMTTGRVIYQAIGFRLDEVSNQQKFNFAVSKIENKIRFERENVLKNIRDSWIKKDFGRYRDWTEKAQAFNMRYPSYAIDIDDVDRSIEGAKERRGMAVRGFVPTEQNVPMFREAVLKRAEAMRRFEEKTKK